MTIDQAALNDLQASFAADGYALSVLEDGGRLRAAIEVARDDACSDCLVPPEVLKPIMAQMLGVSDDTIDITYPA